MLCISSADAEHSVSQLCTYLQHIDQFRQHAKLQQVRTEADDMCDTMLEMVVAGNRSYLQKGLRLGCGYGSHLDTAGGQ